MDNLHPSRKENSLKIIHSSKTDLLTHLDLLTEKVILVGDEAIGLEEKMSWLNSASYLPDSFTIKPFTLNQSKEKDKTLESVLDLLNSFSLPSRLNSLIISCCDELLMNAFFDAPVSDGIVTHKNTHRSVNINSAKPVQLIIGYNDQEIALSVIDQYGSVNSNSIIKHMKKTFTEDSYQEPTRGTGAGIGLSLCVKRNTSLLIKVIPQQSSQFTAFFPIVKNFKEYLEKSQLIGIHIEKT